jgi:hypothetical protein
MAALYVVQSLHKSLFWFAGDHSYVPGVRAQQSAHRLGGIPSNQGLKVNWGLAVNQYDRLGGGNRARYAVV